MKIIHKTRQKNAEVAVRWFLMVPLKNKKIMKIMIIVDKIVLKYPAQIKIYLLSRTVIEYKEVVSN